jgi:hypothetical protein
MKQQPDNLFNEKLENHSMPAPEGAWLRIEQRLQPSKNHSQWLWAKIAATVTLLLAAFILLWMEKEASNRTLTLNEIPKVNTPTVSKPLKQDGAPLTSQPKASVVKQKEKKKIQVVDKKKEPSIRNFSKQEPQIVEAVSTNTSLVEEPTTENSVTAVSPSFFDEPKVSETEPTIIKETKSSTIHYTAAEVNEKFLRPVTTDATSGNENASTWRKLLEKADDMKSNHGTLAELRQRKNEILALNLDKKDKSEKQNN